MSIQQIPTELPKKKATIKEQPKGPPPPPSITEDQFKHRRQKRYFKIFGKPKD